MKKRFFNRRLDQKSNRRWSEGFTFVEIMFSSLILIIVIIGMMQGFLGFSIAKEKADKKLKALLEAQNKIEEIRGADFSSVYNNYNGTSFVLTQVDGSGFIRVDNSNDQLLEIEVVVCWESGEGRVVGEDQNLNGVLDAGEDVNGDGRINSPMTFRTMLTRR